MDQFILPQTNWTKQVLQKFKHSNAFDFIFFDDLSKVMSKCLQSLLQVVQVFVHNYMPAMSCMSIYIICQGIHSHCRHASMHVIMHESLHRLKRASVHLRRRALGATRTEPTRHCIILITSKLLDRPLWHFYGTFLGRYE